MPGGSLPDYLTGQLLIAMPGMPDPRFAQSVVLMLIHDDSQAMGVVINKPAGFMQIGTTEEAIEGEDTEPEQIPVYYGGPVENEVALIVHSADRSDYDSTQIVNEHFCVTSTPNILEDISNGYGPVCRLFILGYSSWRAGQLEGELQQNAWLVAHSSPELVFRTSAGDMWKTAIQSLGINPSMLSSLGGTT